MTNRKLDFIVQDQNPLTLTASATVKEACAQMWARRVGAVLVTDADRRLVGIFTGRDAVRMLAEGGNAATTTLSQVMTPQPKTLGPASTAIEALREMRNGGFRHMPVVDEGRILGIISRGDFLGLELDRLEEETNLWERIG